MKRLFLSIAAGLLCWPMLSQEADEPGNKAEFHLVPRIDANPTFSSSENGFSLGNTSLYTFFDGQLSPLLSFSIANHWLSAKPADLYKNSFRSDATNWVDWINLTCSLGNFDITVGKDCAFAGGWENEDNDVDCHYDITSTFWNIFNTYQWGGSVRYNCGLLKSSFALQACTSPYGEKPFSSGLYMFNAQWRGTFGPFMTRWSYAAIQCGDGQYEHLISLGQKIETDKIILGFDYLNAAGDNDYEELLMPGHTFIGYMTWMPSDKFDFLLKCSFDRYVKGAVTKCSDGWLAGGGIHFYPLRNSRALRLHAIGAYNSHTKTTGLTFGATFDWTHIFK